MPRSNGKKSASVRVLKKLSAGPLTLGTAIEAIRKCEERS
jgi:hypothetical protein